MSNDKDRIDLGGAEKTFAQPHGLSSTVRGGNAGNCANPSCQRFSNSLVNGYCPFCAAGSGPAPITGGRKIPAGHGFHLTVPSECPGGVCSVDSGSKPKDGKSGAADTETDTVKNESGCGGKGGCGDACKCGGNCNCGGSCKK